MTRRSILVAVSAALAAHPAWADLTADQTPFNSFRGVWIDRFDYSVANAQSSISAIMTNAKDLGFTDVVFQVRGQADAYYWLNNGLEPRKAGVTAANDPLAIAITQAHANGLRLHAWINTMPLWSAQQNPGTNITSFSPAAPADHLINQHPEYWIRNAANQPLPFPATGTDYVIVNPAMSAVRQHINDVANAIASNYQIDGLHLDYIRLYSANPGATNPLEYPADPATVALFQQQFPGQTPTSAPAEFKAFMADQVTTLVRSIRDTVKTARPTAQLTASVWRDADIGLDDYQQDWARWIDQGLLDAAMPMIYRKGFGAGGTGLSVDTGDLYRNNVAEAMSRRGTAGIMVGLGTYMQNDAATAYNNTLAQLEYAKAQGANGVQLFDYGTLINGTAAQNEVKRALADFFAANSGVAATTTLTGFDGNEGSFKWSLTFSGSNRNVAASSSADYDGATPGHTGAGSQRILINRGAGAEPFLARHLSGNGSSTATVATFETNTPFPSIGSVGFWLKTTSADVQVGVAVDDTVTADRSYFQNVIPDGQWHKYEWFLADPSHWDAWIAGADGHLNNVVTLDSIQFIGTGDSNTIFLDDVFHNPSAIAANQWTFDANAGTWGNAGHWTGGVPNGVGATANLLRRATTNRAVLLDVPVTLGTLTIDNAQSYTLAGTNALSLDVASGAAAINVVNRGSHTIATPLTLMDNTAVFTDRGSTLLLSGKLTNASGRVITKTGDGILEIAGAQAHGSGAGLVAAGGVTRLSSDGGANLAITATATARVEFAVSQTLASLALGEASAVTLTPGGAKSVVTRALTITGGATLDLGDGALIQDYAAGGASPLAITRGRILSGAIASVTAGSAHALGYAEASEVLQASTFFGRTVDTSAVLVRLTLKGDANLDGAVDFTDLVSVAQSYNTTVSAVTDGWWARGDFTSDGVVDFNDLVALAQNYNGAMPAAGALGAGFEAEWAAANVPEPAGVVVGALAVGGRRRRVLKASPR